MSGMHTVEETESERQRARAAGPVPPIGGSPLPAPPAASATPPEQLVYAKVLARGMYTGLFVLLTTFALYLTGAVAPAVPIDRLPEFWTMEVTEYLEAVNTQFLHHDHVLTGWSWVSVIEHGDYLNFLGIAVLSLVTLVCFLRIIPLLYRKRDYAYLAIALTEVLILALAASGILAVGE